MLCCAAATDEQAENITASGPALAENAIAGPELKEEPLLADIPTKEEVKEEVPKAQVEEAPAAVEQKKVPEAGVVLEFNEGAAPVIITRRPVQLTFDFTTKPVKVLRVAGYAKELGIQVGWTIKSLNGETADSDFQVFYSTFLNRLNSLEGNYVLPLLCQKDNGEKKTYLLSSSPTGLTFDQSLPITVATSEGIAAHVGLKKGWQLLRYDDKPVDVHPNFDAFWADFTTLVNKLPIGGS